MKAAPRIASIVLLFIAIGFSSRNCDGGLTGENVALVVNADSVDSITIANHYVALRHIPESNLIWLKGVPQGLTVSLADFRERILKPVLTTLNQRGRASQIRAIVYSVDFPTSVNIGSHTASLKDQLQLKYQTPTASINSLTYFYRWVLSDSPDYLGWRSNLYARGPFSRHFVNPFSGDPGERFEAARLAENRGDFVEAAEAYQKLAEAYPSMSPLRILAAESWARAEQDFKAIDQVRLAIEKGWVSRRHLIRSESLSRIFDADKNPDLHRSASRLLEMTEDRPIVLQEPIAFSATDGWTASGHRASTLQGAMPYMLSCVLGVKHPSGSDLSQIVETLQRAASADRTFPDGTFGFSKTDDVRTKTRQPGVTDAIAWLLGRDADVEIFTTPLPTRSKRYVGLMLGSPTLATEKRDWELVAGAIAENLTSLNGVFANQSQTKLTALLHAGAAMSSGAVAEPYSLQPKFPTPMLYPYYREGVTAIEAFYLTIESPYQMLIVGDPLCQPYARAPNDRIRIETRQAEKNDADVSQPTALRIESQRVAEDDRSVPTDSVELFIEGRLVAVAPIGQGINVNLPAGLLGQLDCRVVMVGDHPTGPRIAHRDSIAISEPSPFPRIERYRASAQDVLTVFVESENADKIELSHLGRIIATIDGSRERLELTAEVVGRGPIGLRAIATENGKKRLGKIVRFDW